MRDQQKRRAWRQGVVAAVAMLVLLVCVVSALWMVPVFDDDNDGDTSGPAVATPRFTDQSTATP